MTTLQDIEMRLSNLEKAFLQSQTNATATTEKAESADQKIDTVSTNITSNYDSTKTYTLNEYVNYNGNLYRFIKERGSNIEPTNTLYWTLCDIATELNRLYSMIQ